MHCGVLCRNLVHQTDVRVKPDEGKECGLRQSCLVSTRDAFTMDQRSFNGQVVRFLNGFDCVKIICEMLSRTIIARWLNMKTDGCLPPQQKKIDMISGVYHREA